MVVVGGTPNCPWGCQSKGPPSPASLEPPQGWGQRRGQGHRGEGGLSLEVTRILWGGHRYRDPLEVTKFYFFPPILGFVVGRFEEGWGLLVAVKGPPPP